MRALVDTNLLVSSLLSAGAPPNAVVQAGLEARFSLLVSVITIEELLNVCRTKPYLAQRITDKQLLEFVDFLRLGAMLLDTPDTPADAVTRDPKDDYLIGHALAEQVDVLVSGDRDLLVLDGTFPFRILPPADFVAFLSEERG